MTPRQEIEKAITETAVRAIEAVSDGWGEAEDRVAAKEITPALRSLVDAVLEEAAKAVLKPSGHYQIGRNVAPYWSGEDTAAIVRALKSQPTEAKKP